MGAPVTLLLVVGLSGGEVRPGQLAATLNAQLDRTRVQVQMRRADGVPDLERVLELASKQGPVAVVTNPRTGRLAIRVALQHGAWVSRTFNFAQRDPLTERNRTVALAIAAMVPEWRLPQPLPEPEPQPEPAPTSVPPLVEAERFTPPVPVAVFQAPDDPGARAAPVGDDHTQARPVDASPAERSTSPSMSDGGPPLDAAQAPDAGREGVLALAPTGPDAGPVEIEQATPAPPATSGGLGFEVAALAGFWPFAPGAQLGGGYCTAHLCGGLLLRGQRADLPAIDATLWRAGVLAVGRAQVALGSERLRAAAVLSLGPGWVLAQRRGQTQDKWQLEGALEAELSVQVVSGWWLFLRGGLGLASGDTPVWVNSVQTTQLPAYSAQGALGVRVGR